jgi:ribosomal protein S18 acetylase RimI-like enzyme
VLPAAQGRGLGRALTAAVLDLATVVGASDVRLTVWTVNQRAIRLYERMGLTARQLTMGRLLPGRGSPGRADGR